MKKAISTALVLSILFSAGLTMNVSAKSTEEKLKANQSVQKELDEKIDGLNKKIKKVEKKINSADETMKTLNKQSKKIKKDIKKLEKELSKNKINLGDRLKVINDNYSMGYMKVILSSDSISDFLNNIYLVKEVVAQDKQLLKNLENDRDEIIGKQKTLNKNKSEILEIKNNFIKDKKTLDKDKKELEILKDKFAKQEEALEKELQKIASVAKVTDISLLGKDLLSPNSSNAVISNGSWPVPGYTRIASPFGYRTHPVLGVKKLHTGIDIPAPEGTPAVAVADGTVIFAGPKGSYGNAIMIEHDNGLVTLYAHNSKLLVKVGDRVKKGQVVTKIGSTGRVTGPHLHFEVRVNGTPENPINYL
ncbi:M23 family metallopeptidase [Terrisporobacter sp.]